MDDTVRGTQTLKKYLLVSFHLRGRPPKLTSIDVIPLKWIVPSNSKKKLQCFYPTPPYDRVQKLVCTNSDPETNWPIYSIEILGQSRNYKNAEAPLEEIKQPGTKYAFSTDTEADLADKAGRIEQEIKRRKFKEVEGEMKKKMELSLSETSSSPENLRDANSLDKQNGWPLADGVIDASDLSLLEGDLLPTDSMDSSTEELSGIGNIVSPSRKQKRTFSGTLKEPSPKKQKLEEHVCCNLTGVDKLIDLMISMKEEMKFMKEEMRSMKDRLWNIEHSLQGNTDLVSAEMSMPGKYETKLPICSIELLQHFESKLANSRPCLVDTIQVMKRLKTTKVSTSSCEILRKFLSREVAMQYTATKKMNEKFVMELNLPHFMGCIVEALMAVHQGVTEKEAKSVIGTSLTGAKGWDGHRSKNKVENGKGNNPTSAFSSLAGSSKERQLNNNRMHEGTRKGEDISERWKLSHPSLGENNVDLDSESDSD